VFANDSGWPTYPRGHGRPDAPHSRLRGPRGRHRARRRARRGRVHRRRARRGIRPGADRACSALEQARGGRERTQYAAQALLPRPADVLAGGRNCARRSRPGSPCCDRRPRVGRRRHQGRPPPGAAPRRRRRLRGGLGAARRLLPPREHDRPDALHVRPRRRPRARAPCAAGRAPHRSRARGRLRSGKRGSHLVRSPSQWTRERRVRRRRGARADRRPFIRPRDGEPVLRRLAGARRARRHCLPRARPRHRSAPERGWLRARPRQLGAWNDGGLVGAARAVGLRHRVRRLGHARARGGSAGVCRRAHRRSGSSRPLDFLSTRSCCRPDRLRRDRPSPAKSRFELDASRGHAHSRDRACRWSDRARLREPRPARVDARPGSAARGGVRGRRAAANRTDLAPPGSRSRAGERARAARVGLRLQRGRRHVHDRAARSGGWPAQAARALRRHRPRFPTRGGGRCSRRAPRGQAPARTRLPRASEL